MKARRSLQELVQDAGILPIVDRQPCLPAPSQPAIIASEDDHMLARNLLAQQRRNNPEWRDPNKQLTRLFRTSTEKKKLQDTTRWEFTQDEVDEALSAIIDKPTTSPGLVQAFLNLGAKVNFVETSEDKQKSIKKPHGALRRRSTVLQQAATFRKPDSVSLLASSGADQTTLDEGLKAALTSNDISCVRELLRHGADINKFPNALADAVRSNDQNLARLLLRAPKALRPEIISSCLPAAVQHKSEAIISLLIGYGADPNFNNASALHTAISSREYRVAVALAAGPIPLAPVSLQGLLVPVLKMPTAQELHQFLQLLLCCGLSPDSSGLSALLVAASKRNDNPLAHMLISYGVSTESNEAECLRHAIANANWVLADLILETPLSPAHVSVALAVLPTDAPRPERFRIISALVQKGATGPPMGRWLLRAVEEGDLPLVDLLLHAGAPLEAGNNSPLHAAVARKDSKSLRILLNARPSPQSIANVFPMLRPNYSSVERLDTTRLLLEHGARGTEVDQALVDAIVDTSGSRDLALITELVRHGANVNHDNGKVISVAVVQADLSVLHLLCGSKPSSISTSRALPLAFDASGARHATTLQIIELLLANGAEDDSAFKTLRIAVNGGPGNLDIIMRLIETSSRLLGSAFQYAIALDQAQKKAPILHALLQKGIPQEALDEALTAETRQVVSSTDTTILELLLQNGASVNHRDGEALSAGVAAGNIALIKLLLNGKDSASKASIKKAFRALFQDSTLRHTNSTKSDMVEIARELLVRGVEQPSIDSALRTVLNPANQYSNVEVFVDLLLQYHANVNTADGTCFAYAARLSFDVFNKLVAQKPDFRIIAPALIQSRPEEDTLITALQKLFDHGCTSDDLDAHNCALPQKPALVLILQQYPRSSALVKLLLSHGCNPDITSPDTLDPSVGEESLPALLWALGQPQKTISSSVILALIGGGASTTRASPASEASPIILAAREGRPDIVQELLEHGADASARDIHNRSALFYAASTSVPEVVQLLAPSALKDDGSLHEAARCLQLEATRTLLQHNHNPNFPSRLHSGRNALGELCLHASATTSSQRTRLRQLIRLLLDHGANPKFQARNEKSCVLLALDNPHSTIAVTDALLESEIWEDLNDEAHMYRDAATALWYSPLSYTEHIPTASRTPHKPALISLLLDKSCTRKFYSETAAQQPPGATGIPPPIARLVDRQKDHALSLTLAQEAAAHAATLAESTHRAHLRRAAESAAADLAAQRAATSTRNALQQSTHELALSHMHSTERAKRSDAAAWHAQTLAQTREQDSARAQIAERSASAAFAHEGRLARLREGELEHRVGVERKALLDKEALYERNVARQERVTERVNESARLHARLRQERPAIEGSGPGTWGSVD
ncbi:ankyrin repeat-containing domain protein [Massariosphaeria phaeospora]|uniref:Ankyrin repeat-containing domain protein n=1 Tax=Massariosphaeria phaeospora TaxID=100035 RepID=A0A7C8HYS1_9PLEO|nr:ankyrin repeat-containing domain protein [Massariosphaeria phaeospora]